MKVTPLDIRRKEFKRSVRGYSDEEVDPFLDEVADEFERLHQENVELQDRIRQLEEQGATNMQLRNALEKTLVSAQLQADQTTANARKESELILRDAELKARETVSDSYKEVQRVQQALIQLKHLEEDFRFKFRSLLEGHLKLLEEAPINMAAHPVVVEPEPPADDEGTYVVPTAVHEVPEYPGVPEAVRAEAPAPSEIAAGVAAAVPADDLVPAEALSDLGPATLPTAATATREPEPPVVWANEPVRALSSEAETVEQASIFAELDDAELEGDENGVEEPTDPARDEDPLSSFFFGSALEGTEDTLGNGDKGGDSKPRDFEW